MFCVFGIFLNHFSLRKRAEREEEPLCGRSSGDYLSAKSVVERTAGDTTGRVRFEDSASM